MLIIANRQLTGDYGTVAPNQSFDCDEATAVALIKRGLARPISIRQTYETKVMVPAVDEAIRRYTVSEPAAQVAAEPFRDVLDRDEESPALVALRNAVYPEPVVSPPGDADSVIRRRRGRPRKSE